MFADYLIKLGFCDVIALGSSLHHFWMIVGYNLGDQAGLKHWGRSRVRGIRPDFETQKTV